VTPRGHRILLALIAGALTLTAACSLQAEVDRASPTCNLDKSLNALILEAQSVPTAERVPCVATVPAGWRIASANARSGRSELIMANDRAGAKALVVHLESRCNARGTTEIPSDEPGARRFERIESVTPGFDATRYYLSPGGCITYQFKLSPKGRTLVNEASLAVATMSRAKLDSEVRRRSHGRVHL